MSNDLKYKHSVLEWIMNFHGIHPEEIHEYYGSREKFENACALSRSASEDPYQMATSLAEEIYKKRLQA